MIEQGRYRPLEEWLDSLPRDLVENDPWLLYWKGASRSPFDPSLAQPYFEQAFEQFKVHGDLSGILLAWSGVVYSIIYRFEEYISPGSVDSTISGVAGESREDYPPGSLDPGRLKHVHSLDLSTSRTFWKPRVG